MCDLTKQAGPPELTGDSDFRIVCSTDYPRGAFSHWVPKAFVGASVKKEFRLPDEDGDSVSELMWVHVVGERDGVCIGILENEPLADFGLHAGDEVAVKPEEVLTVGPTDYGPPPEAELELIFWASERIEHLRKCRPSNWEQLHQLLVEALRNLALKQGQFRHSDLEVLREARVKENARAKESVEMTDDEFLEALRAPLDIFPKEEILTTTASSNGNEQIEHEGGAQ